MATVNHPLKEVANKGKHAEAHSFGKVVTMSINDRES